MEIGISFIWSVFIIIIVTLIESPDYKASTGLNSIHVSTAVNLRETLWGHILYFPLFYK